MSTFLKTRTAINNCRNFLEEIDVDSDEIESYLTNHLIVLLYRDLETEIQKLLDDRLKLSGDKELTDFASHAGRKILRSYKKSELCGFLAKFGEHIKEKFDSELDGKDREVTRYNSVIQSRHTVSHSGAAQITFRELDDALDCAEIIVQSARKALLP